MHVTTTLKEIVISVPAATDIFDRYNIDYYCNGMQTLLEASVERGIDVDALSNELMNATPSVSCDEPSWRNCSPAILSTLIFQHYNDAKAQISMILEVINEMSLACEPPEAEMLDVIRSTTKQLLVELIEHSKSEEKMLLAPLKARRRTAFSRNHVDDSIRQMEDDHRELGTLLSKLRTATENYSPKNFTSANASFLLIILKQLDKELTRRLHLENNILFPKMRTQERNNSFE